MATCKHITDTEKIQTRPSRLGRLKGEYAGHKRSQSCLNLALALTPSFLVAKGKREKVSYDKRKQRSISASQRTRSSSQSCRIKKLMSHTGFKIGTLGDRKNSPIPGLHILPQRLLQIPGPPLNLTMQPGCLWIRACRLLHFVSFYSA